MDVSECVPFRGRLRKMSAVNFNIGTDVTHFVLGCVIEAFSLIGFCLRLKVVRCPPDRHKLYSFVLREIFVSFS